MAANEGSMGMLHDLLARQLIAKIESGEASASELAVAFPEPINVVADGPVALPQ